MAISLLPTTKEGWMQFEFMMIGIIVTCLMAGMFLAGIKVGYGYGLRAAGIGI
jgi:hypothetical protein